MPPALGVAGKPPKETASDLGRPLERGALKRTLEALKVQGYIEPCGVGLGSCRRSREAARSESGWLSQGLSRPKTNISGRCRLCHTHGRRLRVCLGG